MEGKKEEELGFGFNKSKIESEVETDLRPYMDGKPRLFQNHHASVAGVLTHIGKKYAEFKPAITYNLNGTYSGINNQEATRIPLPIIKVSPLLEGASLEDYVADFNLRNDNEDTSPTIIIP